ncbi:MULTISPECIES: flagellar basal body-associated protein FliL [unclassified Thioalkalivibrio]|uniref:flagellar basal body-associated FliL family protein n=1 Tax=unclassified Thioalkalivibrio TaxID=2621013 RepID=UPI00037FE25E|nr:MULTISPECIES: flagellar basal body-associated FliL family protein [unclassified Thioalkalivibrio]
MIRPTFFALPTALLGLILLLAAPLATAVDDLDSHYVTLEPVVVNMEASDRGRYLQASIQLEGNNLEDARQIREHIPAVRDRLIRILGGRSPESLTGSGAREDLRNEATDELNALLEEITGSPRIAALYFSDFIRQ